MAQNRLLLNEYTQDNPHIINERARRHDSEVSVAKVFFSIPRTMQRYVRYRNNKECLKNHTITDSFTNIHNIIQFDIKGSFYKICIISNNLKKRVVKQIASEILPNRNMLHIKIKNYFYDYVLDITDIKT